MNACDATRSSCKLIIFYRRDFNDAATALSMIPVLQAENAQLRTELEYEREHANAYHEERGQRED